MFIAGVCLFVMLKWTREQSSVLRLNNVEKHNLCFSVEYNAGFCVPYGIYISLEDNFAFLIVGFPLKD